MVILPGFKGEAEFTQAVLQFNENFEQAGQRTNQFMREIKDMGLLMDGEVSIQPDGAPQPFIYRGFQMVDEKKLNEMSAIQGFSNLEDEVVAVPCDN